MNKIKKTLLITLTILTMLTLCSLLTLRCVHLVQASSRFDEVLTPSQRYDKELLSYVHSPNKNEDFSDAEIIVILTKEYSNFDFDKCSSSHNCILDRLSKFENIDINTVKDLSPLQNRDDMSATYRKILSLRLQKHGKK